MRYCLSCFQVRSKKRCVFLAVWRAHQGMRSSTGLLKWKTL